MGFQYTSLTDAYYKPQLDSQKLDLGQQQIAKNALEANFEPQKLKDEQTLNGYKVEQGAQSLKDNQLERQVYAKMNQDPANANLSVSERTAKAAKELGTMGGDPATVRKMQDQAVTQGYKEIQDRLIKTKVDSAQADVNARDIQNLALNGDPYARTTELYGWLSSTDPDKKKIAPILLQAEQQYVNQPEKIQELYSQIATNAMSTANGLKQKALDVKQEEGLANREMREKIAADNVKLREKIQAAAQNNPNARQIAAMYRTPEAEDYFAKAYPLGTGYPRAPGGGPDWKYMFDQADKVARGDASVQDPFNKQVAAKQEQQTFKDFSPAGVPGKAIRAINVATDHLDTYRELAKALDNGNWSQTYNKYKNSIAEEFGSVDVSNFESVKRLIASEVIKSVVGTQFSDTDRTEQAQSMLNKKTAGALEGNIKTIQKLLGGQAAGLEQSFVSGVRSMPEAQARKEFRERYAEDATRKWLNDIKPIKASATATPADFPRVTPSQQAERDVERDGLRQGEMKAAQKILDDPYADRSAKQQAQQDLDSLNREADKNRRATDTPSQAPGAKLPPGVTTSGWNK